MSLPTLSSRECGPVDHPHTSVPDKSLCVCVCLCRTNVIVWQEGIQGGTLTKLSPSCAVVDTLVWQGLASVVIPGFTINRVCLLSRLLLRQGQVMSPALQRWTVTAIGLGCIPFIIQPIDR